MQAGGDGEEQEAFDWREYYHALKDRLWILLLCMVLGAMGALFYLSRAETLYQASSVLLIQQEQNRVFGQQVQAVRDEQVRGADMINTMVDLLKSYTFAQRVVSRFNLNTDPAFLAATSVEASSISADKAASLLQKHVVPTYRPETFLIDIVATTEDPKVSSTLANAYVDEYIRFLRDQRKDAIQSANQYLVDEAERLRKEMRVSEEAMQSFRERERTTSLQTMQDEAQAKIAEVSKRITETEEKLSQLNADLSAAQAKQRDPAALLNLPSVAAEPKVVQINSVVTQNEQDFTIVEQRYGSSHPMYVAAKQKLDLSIKDRNALLQSVISLLETSRQQLQAQLKEAKSSRDANEKRLLQITSKTVEYNVLSRELESNKVLYDSVLGRLKEVDMTKGLSEIPVTVQERATGATPIIISKPKIWALGLLGGLFAGAAIALGLNFLDHSVKTIDQLERWTGLKVLAAVSKIKTKKRNERVGLVSVQDRDGQVAESFRTLRAALALAPNKEQRQVFIFTSALPSEGKTFCSSNFAATLAQQGFRTLYIDADLRKPEVSRMLFGKHRKPGLTEVLMGEATLEEAILSIDLPNLSILTAGGRSNNPSELLSLKSFSDLITHAREHYDRVVIDSAPVIAVSDSLLIAGYADACCLVVRSLATPKKTITRAVGLLADVNRTPAGIVINFLPDRGGHYYYYSGRYQEPYGGGKEHWDEKST